MLGNFATICLGLLETHNMLCVLGCKNCHISVNNGNCHVAFQPCDYKYFQKSALRYQLWPSCSQLIFNENASFLEFEFRSRVHFK